MLSGLLILLLSIHSWAQVEHSATLDTRPNEFIRLTAMRIRFSTAPIASKNQISIDYHISNTWNPTTGLQFPGTGLPPLGPGETVTSPSYASRPDEYKIYTADGVLRGLTARLIHKTSENNEVSITLNTYMLVGGNNKIDALVSDQLIENVHKNLWGQSDPFRRLINPLNRAQFQFIDRQGREFNLGDGSRFSGTLDLSDIKYIRLIQNKHILWSMNLGAHVGVPLNSFRSFVSDGVSVGTALTGQVYRSKRPNSHLKGYSITFASGFMAQDDQAIRLHSDKINFADQRYVQGYRIALNQNFDYRNKRQFVLGVELQGMTRPTSNRDGARGPVDVTAIGLKNVYKDDYWTPTNDYNVTNEARGARSLITGSEYITLNLSYRFGDPKTAPSVSVYAQEDWKLFYGDKPFLLFLSSDNVQDWGVGVKLTQPIAWKKRR